MSASTGPAVPRASVALIGDRPVLDPRVLGDFGWVLPAAAIVHEGTIHVWVVAFGEVRGDQRPFHLTSADGLTWDVEEGDLASQLGVAYSPPGPVPTSIQVGDGGQWVMYYHGVRPPETDGGEIWRATAEGPSGPWTADAEPLLAAGGAGSWSGRAVDFPSVVQTGNGHVMAFGGHDSRTSIGIATSDDGVTWRPPDEPAISAGLCGGFDDFSVAQPRFVRHGEDGWELVYVGFDTPSARALGLARSVDGLEWTCASPEPLLRSSDIPGSTLVHSFVALTSEDEGADAVRLLVESLRRDGSELWLAELRLRP